MKKIILVIVIATLTSNVFAQFETGLKLGASNYSDNSPFASIPTSAIFFAEANFGYRFFNNEHITLIPKIFVSKSGFVLQDLTFVTPSPTGVFETSDINYRLYNAGLNVATEIKLLKLDKKVNFYLAPNFSYRRVMYSEGIPSNPKLGSKTGSATIQQNFIVDWGLEIGVKLAQFKFGVSYQDVLNKGNRDNSSFVIVNTFSFSVSYLFGGKGKVNNE